jgi:hypothetical protein
MCRNIRPLYNFEPPATDAEAYDAALQFVRKVSGFSKPSPKDREVEAAKRKARSAQRYAA